MTTASAPGIFSIDTPEAFLAKAEADVAVLNAAIADPSLAINAFLSLYHLHEWVWARRLKATAPFDLDGTIIRSKGEFVAWCDGHCPNFALIQDVANGTKHCSPRGGNCHAVSGYGSGPYGVGPYGMSYLLIDLGEAAGEDRWKVAHVVAQETATFWRTFIVSWAAP